MKMRILLDKINVDFLSQTKTSVETELEKIPCQLNYSSALKLFRNKVNSKYPLQTTTQTSTRRRGIQSANSRQYGGAKSGRSRSRGRGRGFRRSGRGGRGNHGKRRSSGHPNARMIVCTDGTHMEVHPSYQFSSMQWEVIS